MMTGRVRWPPQERPLNVQSLFPVNGPVHQRNEPIGDGEAEPCTPNRRVMQVFAAG